MKTFIFIVLGFLISLNGMAQKKGKYNIKIVERTKIIDRGIFYALNDSALVIITKAGDTISIKNSKIKHLYIQRRGIILPVVILGAAIVTALFLPLESYYAPVSLLIGLGVGIGGGVGNLIGELIANKKFYRNLEIKDFVEIKPVLQKYTQIK